MAQKNETLFHSEFNPAPKSVFKQELITWEETEDGLIRKYLTRNFLQDRHYDSYVSEPILRPEMGDEAITNGQLENITPPDLERLKWLIERDQKGELGYPSGLGLSALRKKYPRNHQQILDDLQSS